MDFIFEHKDVFIPIITSIIAFLSGRKSKILNNKSTELANIEKVREIEKTLLDDMEDQVKKMITYTNHLEDVVNDLKVNLTQCESNYTNSTNEKDKRNT